MEIETLEGEGTRDGGGLEKKSEITRKKTSHEWKKENYEPTYETQ